MSTGGVVIGGAVIAVLLVIVPGEVDPEFTADCVGSAAVNVRPDTHANRDAAADWCQELAAFQRTDRAARVVETLWGK